MRDRKCLKVFDGGVNPAVGTLIIKLYPVQDFTLSPIISLSRLSNKVSSLCDQCKQAPADRKHTFCHSPSLNTFFFIRNFCYVIQTHKG